MVKRDHFQVWVPRVLGSHPSWTCRWPYKSYGRCRADKASRAFGGGLGADGQCRGDQVGHAYDMHLARALDDLRPSCRALERGGPTARPMSHCNRRLPGLERFEERLSASEQLLIQQLGSPGEPRSSCFELSSQVGEVGKVGGEREVDGGDGPLNRWV